MIRIAQEQVGPWALSAVVFERETHRIHLPVLGIIGNSVPTSANGKAVTLSWKRTVAAAAKQARGEGPLESKASYAVSASFSFHPGSHGHQGLDVENFLKPTFDGLAAGLFCAPNVDCLRLERFAYDDTGFRHLYVYRQPDAASASQEGVGIIISVLEGTS